MQVDLRIAVWNANGLSNHQNEINLFIKTHNIDILLISETHFSSKSYFNIRGYEIITANHPSGRAQGGSAVIVKKSLHYKYLDSICQNNIQAAAIEVHCMHIKISIAAVYLPPRYAFKTDDFKRMFQSFGNHFIVGGDYNAKHPWWGSRLINPKGSELYKCISNNNYSTLSTGKPTYWPTDHRKIPDLLDFIVHFGLSQQDFQIEDNFDLSSDHSPIIITYGATVKFVQKPYRIIKRDTDINGFQNWLTDQISLDVSLKTAVEVDTAVENLTNAIHASGNLFTPQQPTCTNRQQFLPLDLRRQIEEKRKLRKKWQTTRSPADKQRFNKAVKNLNRKLCDIKNQGTANYLKNLDITPSNTDHNLWRATRYLKRPTKKTVVLLDNNGHRLINDDDKAEAFAQHLHSAFQPNPEDDINNTLEVQNFLESPCQLAMPIRKTSLSEVEEEIKCINIKKSPGYDKIDGVTLKYLPTKCIKLLTFIFNAMLRLEYFPSQWKCAEVIMLLKPNKSESCLSSYRPISLLVTFSKVFERILLRRMSPVLAELNIIPEHQFGFRSGHGTVEQCNRITKSITNAFECKQYCAGVFLDVKQAFDKVWHLGLLYKIKKWLPASYYFILKSYLSDRTFYVQERNEKSELCKIAAGVPQGSVLGPVLYTLFTADIPVCENVQMGTYADDTAIIATSENPVNASSYIQNELSILEKWLKYWRIVINVEKSAQITFTLRRGVCPPVTLNGLTMPVKETVKYLGVHLDRRLTWKPHIKAKQTQLKAKTKKMYWLLGPRSQLSLENKIRIYKAILKPVWTYAVQLWGTACDSNIQILQRYQSMTLRTITGAPWYISNFDIHRDMNIPFVKDEIKRFAIRYTNRLDNHINTLAIELLDNSMDVRRLRRFHVLDLPYR